MPGMSGNCCREYYQDVYLDTIFDIYVYSDIRMQHEVFFEPSGMA